MISFRGILAFLIGSIFVILGLSPEYIEEKPPLIISIIIFGCGLLLLYAGIVSIIFVIQRYRIIKSHKPLDCTFEITKPDSESSIYELRIKVQNTEWLLCSDACKATAKCSDQKTHTGKVWLHPYKNLPYALEAYKLQFNTLPTPQLIKPKN